MEENFYQDLGENVDKLTLLLRINLLAPVQEMTGKCNGRFMQLGITERGVIAALISMETCNITQLRRRTSVTYPYLCRVLDKMEESGLVERRPSSKDKKSVNVLLTDTGRQVVDEFNEMANDIAKTYLSAVFSDAEQIEINELMKSLVSYLNRLTGLCA